MKHRRIIGIAWALVGGACSVVVAAQLLALAADPEYGLGRGFYEPSWWFAQMAMLAFIISCAAVGVGLAAAKSWGLFGLRTLGPLALFYLLAYNVFGGERAWWVSVGALALTVVVGASLFFAFKSASQNAA